MILYGTTVLLSAFLLFLVQPLIAKYILPWFGGTPAVWTTCMLFFQVLLLGGYSYAHILTRRLVPRRQALLHLFLTAAALLTLPVRPSEYWKTAGDPAWSILVLLAVSIGAPYFLLSTTGPLLQAWFGLVRPGTSPYRLYALSNLGSLLAIAGYPFIIEPTLALSLQSRLWSWSYFLFALLCAMCASQVFRAAAFRSAGREPEAPDGAADSAGVWPQVGDRAMWLALPACSSAILLATTNQLCQDVAVIPLLWVLPLSIYLLSFIICFRYERVYSRIWFGLVLAAAMAQACVVLHRGVFLDLRLQIASYSFTLFASCMFCHGELVALKPHIKHLTSYYWMIAAGGALGGAFVSIVAPRLFRGFWEFHLALVCTSLLLLVALLRDRAGFFYRGRPWWAWSLLWTAFVALIIGLGAQIQDTLENTVMITRNFFGVLRVLDEEKEEPLERHYSLMHGRIEHGFQFLTEEKRYWPTSYFGPDSGVGLAIRFHPLRQTRSLGTRNMRIGVVGLGVGTLATYGEPNDTVRFYEINPEVLRVCDAYFTYRSSTPALVEVVLGDARISLEHEKESRQPQQFDVLAVDAFSSDAIPVHLLTRECFSTYWYHLKPDGILAMHISSRYFNLGPIVRGLATLDPEHVMRAVLVSDPGEESRGTDSTDWVLLTRNSRFLEVPEVHNAISPWPSEGPAPLLWTDDYSNLFRLYKP